MYETPKIVSGRVVKTSREFGRASSPDPFSKGEGELDFFSDMIFSNFEMTFSILELTSSFVNLITSKPNSFNRIVLASSEIKLSSKL